MRNRRRFHRFAKAIAVPLALTIAACAGLPPAGAVSVPQSRQAVPASSPEPPAPASLEEKRAWCRFEVDRRLLQLDHLDGEVTGSRSLSGGHRAKLSAALAGTRQAVVALDEALASETDRVKLNQLCRELESEQLIFSLRTPQVRNIVGADTVLTLSRSLRVISDELGPLIDAAETNGKPNVSRMRELNDAVVVLTSDAAARVDGVSDALLRLTPPDWRANRQVLAPFQDRNRLSRVDLGAARAHIAEIRRLLDGERSKPSVEPRSTGLIR